MIKHSVMVQELTALIEDLDNTITTLQLQAKRERIRELVITNATMSDWLSDTQLESDAITAFVNDRQATFQKLIRPPS